MILKTLEQADYPSAKNVWKACFEDTDEFIDWYFLNYVQRGRSLGAFDEGELLAMLHIIERKLVLCGQKVDCPYIVGVATLPKARSQGYARALIIRAFELMRESGVAVCALHPVNYQFYHRFGFGVHSWRAKFAFDNTAPPIETRPLSAEHMHLAYEKFMSARGSYSVRGVKDCALKIEEAALDKAKAVEFDGGYAIFSKDAKGSLRVSEYAYENVDSLLGALAHGEVELLLPEGETLGGDTGETVPFGMIRVIDVQKAFTGIPAKGGGVISVHDNCCAWNNTAFDFSVEGGRLRVSRSREYVKEMLSIDKLSQMLTGVTTQETLRPYFKPALQFDMY